jgi:hypothetical protein
MTAAWPLTRWLRAEPGPLQHASIDVLLFMPLLLFVSHGRSSGTTWADGMPAIGPGFVLAAI